MEDLDSRGIEPRTPDWESDVLAHSDTKRPNDSNDYYIFLTMKINTDSCLAAQSGRKRC